MDPTEFTMVGSADSLPMGFAEECEESDGGESVMISEINGPSETISSPANMP